jgi:hypothetical protein
MEWYDRSSLWKLYKLQEYLLLYYLYRAIQLLINYLFQQMH